MSLYNLPKDILVKLFVLSRQDLQAKIQQLQHELEIHEIILKTARYNVKLTCDEPECNEYCFIFEDEPGYRTVIVSSWPAISFAYDDLQIRSVNFKAGIVCDLCEHWMCHKHLGKHPCSEDVCCNRASF